MPGREAFTSVLIIRWQFQLQASAAQLPLSDPAARFASVHAREQVN